MMQSFKDILHEAKFGKPKRLLTSLRKEDLNSICRAAEAGFIIPCFIGDGQSIESMIRRSPQASLEYEIVDERDPEGMLPRAISLIREKQADILMQGSFDQRSFCDAVLKTGTGLRKGKVASYVSLFELPGRAKLILMSDTFLNSRPTIGEKVLILENSLALSRILGIDAPKVAVLAAIEQVNPSIPSTLDAAVLSKMSERGQFGRAIVEGPLDQDCALSRVAAKRKGIDSPVTGEVDIFIVPEVDTGYLLAESLAFIGRFEAAGMVMGTVCPMILDLPFVSQEGKLVEMALASLALERGGEDG